jgi:hypothetical protein
MPFKKQQFRTISDYINGLQNPKISIGELVNPEATLFKLMEQCRSPDRKNRPRFRFVKETLILASENFV